MIQSDMNVLDAIRTRRSIRAFTDGQVTREQMDTLLDAGFYAPSASDRRPWEFVVIRERETLDNLARYGRFMKMFFQAQAGIAVCCNEKRMPMHDLLLNDCSAAAQNILLAAHGIGLGAVWCGVLSPHMTAFYRELLSLPPYVLPVAMIAVGWPAEKRTAKARFAAEHVHDEKFSENEATPERGMPQ